MDTIDKNILVTLQAHGRITNVELARMNDLAPSSMLERVRRLEERGVIKGYRAIVDPKAIGYNIQAMVLINLDRHQLGPIDEFEGRVRVIPEVRAAYHLTGRYDYILHVVVRDIEHLGDLVKHTVAEVRGVEKVETMLALSTVKDDEGFSLQPLTRVE